MHLQTQTEWEEEMSGKIFSFVKNELYLDLRFMKPALAALEPKMDERLQTLATDGIYLYHAPAQVIRVFESNPKFLDRVYLHSILHCIFAHLWMRGERDGRLWNLACDIVTEYTIDKMDKPCTRRILSWNRQRIYQRMEQTGEGIAAAVIYRQLKAWKQEDFRSEQEHKKKQTVYSDKIQPEGAVCRKEREENECEKQQAAVERDIWEQTWLAELEKEFYTDDHCYWPDKQDDNIRQQIAKRAQENWQKIARQTRMEQELRGDETEDGEELFATQIKAGRGRRSYRDFLKQFSMLREELHPDPEEFDLNYYTYGLRLYGNMPLIEPVESREVYQIQEFVIAIDTSYSTSGELVENFLQETFELLMERSRFSGKSKIRIIQCDNQVQMDEEVTSQEQLTHLLENFTIAGGGGTDFRPVFAYVNELIEQGQLQNLGGLLYFTDGKGVYPKKRPDYKTAFLFLNEYEEENIPPWAMRVRLEPEEFEREH